MKGGMVLANMALVFSAAQASFATTNASKLRWGGYTYTSDVERWFDLFLDDCKMWDNFTSGQIDAGKDVYRNGYNTNTSYYNLTAKDYPGEFFNDIIVAGMPEGWINQQVLQGDWRLHWGPLDSGIRTPFHTLVHATKGKELLHQWDVAIDRVKKNQSVPGTWHHIDVAYALWAGNISSACSQGSMKFVTAFSGNDLGAVYRSAFRDQDNPSSPLLHDSLMQHEMAKLHGDALAAIRDGNATKLRDLSIQVASILGEFGLQFMLREAHLVEYSQYCNVSDIVETGWNGARDVINFTSVLLKGLSQYPNGTANAPVDLAVKNLTTIVHSNFTAPEIVDALVATVNALPLSLGIDFHKLGTSRGPPQLGSPPGFFWLYAGRICEYPFGSPVYLIV